MKTRMIVILVAAVALLALLLTGGGVGAYPPERPRAQGGAPTVVSYQGQVTVGDSPYTGTGYLKFAIVNAAGNTTYWSNDGSSTGGGEPASAVSLGVANGLFNVLLGDTSLGNMTQALSASVFSGTDRYLRVWFSTDNVTFEQLSPDQRIAAVPFALQAQVAADAGPDGGPHDHWGETWSGSGIGLTLNSSNNDGLRVSGGDDGIQVESANDDGVFVKSAGEDGVLVESAGRDAFSVVNAGVDGLYVAQAGDDGVDVRSAGGVGVYVGSAGHGLQVDSATFLGVAVGSAGDDGFHVESATDDGVYVGSAGNDGVHVKSAGLDGVYVESAGRYGVYADTTATYGFYTPDKIYAGNGYVDIAEHIDAASDVEPGDVVVIDPENDERVVKSTKPYDSSVAGIISTDPALLIGKSDTETPLALAGRAPCKVSAENGAIHRGDLLTTSSTPGHAMKATEPKLGTILGKALGELESGTGVIYVLVILQ